jgi:hypothetical protein|tara:strand:+ start:237 stop:953 length:717 start_codon:yes stop_codon:yes gene_type:complete
MSQQTISYGSIEEQNDYYYVNNNNNDYFCIAFSDYNTKAVRYYNEFIKKYNNLPKDKDASIQHFNTIQNWLVLNYNYASNGSFSNVLKQINKRAQILLLFGWGRGAKNLWKYLLLNKLPILLLDPELNEQDLEYYKSMSNKQRNMTIINCNSDNWNNNKQIQRQLRILENNYQNFDNSLIKQPNNNGLSATHNLIGQPLFNNNIIIKAYDAVLNTSYYRDKVKIYDLQEDRYIRRYNI